MQNLAQHLWGQMFYKCTSWCVFIRNFFVFMPFLVFLLKYLYIFCRINKLRTKDKGEIKVETWKGEFAGEICVTVYKKENGEKVFDVEADREGIEDICYIIRDMLDCY